MLVTLSLLMSCLLLFDANDCIRKLENTLSYCSSQTIYASTSFSTVMTLCASIVYTLQRYLVMHIKPCHNNNNTNDVREEDASIIGLESASLQNIELDVPYDPDEVRNFANVRTVSRDDNNNAVLNTTLQWGLNTVSTILFVITVIAGAVPQVMTCNDYVGSFQSVQRGSRAMINTSIHAISMGIALLGNSAWIGLYLNTLHGMYYEDRYFTRSVYYAVMFCLVVCALLCICPFVIAGVSLFVTSSLSGGGYVLISEIGGLVGVQVCCLIVGVLVIQ